MAIWLPSSPTTCTYPITQELTLLKHPISKRTTPHPLTPSNHSPTREHPKIKTNATIGLFLAAMLLQHLATVPERRLIVCFTNTLIRRNRCLSLKCVCTRTGRSLQKQQQQQHWISLLSFCNGHCCWWMFACARLGDVDAHNQGVMKSFSSRKTNSRNQSIHTDANVSSEKKKTVKNMVGICHLEAIPLKYTNLCCDFYVL